MPYKVFAGVAAEAGIGWPELLTVSVPARACRFLVVIMITAGANHMAARWLGTAERTWLLLAGWVLFYAVFWFVMAR